MKANRKTETDEVTVSWINVREHGACGSECEVKGRMARGSSRMRVEDSGDFRSGQWVMVAHSHVNYTGIIYEAGQAPWKAENQIPLNDEIELRGFDITRTWQTFILLFSATKPGTFSWLVVDPEFQKDLKHWTWQKSGLAMNDQEWHPLANGVEMHLRKLDWAPGQVVVLHARGSLVTRIEEISGKDIILADAATQDTSQAVLRHFDQYALQSAIDQAVAEKKSVLIPAGRYRLRSGLQVKNACFRIEGEHRANTILDISEGNGPVFNLTGGQEVTIRNLGMVGHTGLNQGPWVSFEICGRFPFWPLANQQAEVRGCSAAIINGTERVLFEDLHVARMASEAFYSHGPGRFEAGHGGTTQDGNTPYTKSIVYHRCVVMDCASNAFNNNDFAENTSILYCYVENVYNFFEQSGRFTRVIGNTVRKANHYGSIGNVSDASRKSFLDLGTGQTIIANNVFEGEPDPKYPGQGHYGIHIGHGPTQIIVSGNIFVNFGQRNPLTISGRVQGAIGRPARSITVTGNIIDLTSVGNQIEKERAGIYISASNLVVSDNQIYARGECSSKTAGILISEQAVNITVHDNLIENCGRGIQAGLIPLASWFEKTDGIESEVVEVLGPGAFSEKNLCSVWDYTAGYRNWILRWLTGSNAGKSSRITGFKQSTATERKDGFENKNKAAVKVIELADALVIKTGDRFVIFPAQANWNIHHNTITGCRIPVELQASESGTSCFKDNIIACGAIEPAPKAIAITGKIKCSNNVIDGFDQESARQD